MDRASNSSEPAAALPPLVLVVDDSPTMRRSVLMSLELGGYRVVSASSGAEALRLLRDGLRPDLVLTDIVMPELDGLGLIAEARKLLRFTPIVALTTQADAAMRQRGRDAGATGWLLKPTGGRKLLDLVARLIGHKTPRAAAAAPVPAR